MCGIVGYVGTRPVVDILIKGLRRLEYRGYDSAGVAFFQGGNIEIHKAEGKLQNVEKILTSASHGSAHCGIGHTRWATHGKPTTLNAHPHRTGHVVLVHNGIIENYQEIKRDLISRGHKPQSDTDSELFGFLVLEEMEKKSTLVEAVRKSFSQLQGQCSVVVMSEREPDVIVGVRNGSPLVAAIDPKGGSIVASDAQPLLEFTKDVFYLEHGDIVVGTKDKLEFRELATGKKVERQSSHLDWSVDQLDKQGFDHYMLKEIHEQPTTLLDTLNALLDRTQADHLALADQPGVKILKEAKELTIVACGTAWHAALLGKYWLEKWAQIPVNVELASEFRYREAVLRPGAVVVGVSQSGETADTLAVIREIRKKGILTVAITNTRGSTLSREASATFFTSAGPEIGVAATKTFTAQMAGLLTLAVCLSRQPAQATAHMFGEIIRLPHLLTEILMDGGETVKATLSAAEKLQGSKGFFFIGRGYSFPMALEGALKLKEIAYIHAEGYAAGELKHGPIAMIDEDMCVVVLAPKDIWRDKTVSNLEEVKARGAKILGIGNTDDQRLRELCDQWIPLSSRPGDESLLPFVLAPVLQILSYRIAVLKGTDVDKPRNLAKSVTVE